MSMAIFFLNEVEWKMSSTAFLPLAVRMGLKQILLADDGCFCFFQSTQSSDKLRQTMGMSAATATD